MEFVSRSATTAHPGELPAQRGRERDAHGGRLAPLHGSGTTKPGSAEVAEPGFFQGSDVVGYGY